MPKKADRNQGLFTAAARALGFLVQPIHMVGQGAPDLIVSGRSGNGTYPALLVELKCNDWGLGPKHPHWINSLTKDEQAWHIKWRYAPVVITNRLRHVLAWLEWPDDDIRQALATLPTQPTVKAALRAVERRDGEVSSEIMATIEFE